METVSSSKDWEGESPFTAAPSDAPLGSCDVETDGPEPRQPPCSHEGRPRRTRVAEPQD